MGSLDVLNLAVASESCNAIHGHITFLSTPDTSLAVGRQPRYVSKQVLTLQAGGGTMQGPLLGMPSNLQAWASKYTTEPPRLPVEVGDDGVPLGVFERHNLSPQRTPRTVAIQNHLDSWRLTELRAAAVDAAGAVLQADLADRDMPISKVPGVAAAARPPSWQLQRKLTKDCMLAESTAAAAGDSAMQGMISMQKAPFTGPRQRPSMHSVQCPALPAGLPRHSSPAFCIPTTIQTSEDQALRSASPGSCSFGGKGRLEENVWAGIGGLGRNGRSSSIAALQTPRPKAALQM